MLHLAVLMSFTDHWSPAECCGQESNSQLSGYSNVDVQPLVANVRRMMLTLENIGFPVPGKTLEEINAAIESGKSMAIQKALDQITALEIVIHDRDKITHRQLPDAVQLYQFDYHPLVVRVVNPKEIKGELVAHSAQSGAVYSGTSLFSLERQKQTELGKNQNESKRDDRYLDLEFYKRSPMSPKLGGLAVEYKILLLHCSESGSRSPSLLFELAGNKDAHNPESNGSRINLKVTPAIPVTLEIKDSTQQTANPIARIEIRDQLGRIYPNQPKRLAPDFFFQPHIYRRSGEKLLLTPGEYSVRYCRGPEYRLLEKKFRVVPAQSNILKLELNRWIHPEKLGFYSGDHHIHAAGCAHYTSPTEGVTPAHMYRQVAGEGLNVGCVLTWGPCFDFQRKFFSPDASIYDNRETQLKYDIEVSGFGSQALGHVCLLNLKDQTFPDSGGTKSIGWPTWTTPVMRWAKNQGGYTGYAHSASGLAIDPTNASKRLLSEADLNRDGQLSKSESSAVLLPFRHEECDNDQDGFLSQRELVASHLKSAGELPNYSIPEMNGVGAMEICVSAVEGVCDFISAMDTARIQEWNTWYHLLNCGFPIKVSGETDFPCMSSVRVGKGRVYVDLGKNTTTDEPLKFSEWCESLAKGRSYVSDGFAHAVQFEVNGRRPGYEPVQLGSPAPVKVKFTVAFAPQTPDAVAHGTQSKSIEVYKIGDTVELHHPREHKWITGGTRKVELIVNGKVVAARTVKADGKSYAFEEEIDIQESSWIAVRQFPQLHTNPVNVLVAGKPIRASRRSALWCIGMTELVWKNRQRTIAPRERPDAEKAFQKTLLRLREIANEAKKD